MKNPFEFADRLFRYLGGEMAEAESRNVEKELTEDEALKVLARELRDKASIRRELQLMQSFDAERALQKVIGKSRRPKRYRIAWRVAVAAAVVVAVGGAWWLDTVREQSGEMPVVAQLEPGKAKVLLETAGGVCYALDTLSHLYLTQEKAVIGNREGLLQWQTDSAKYADSREHLAYNRITVPNAATYTMILPDGTKVYLNSGSKLEFPSRFAEGERRVKVSGEVYCEVTHHAEWPFVVETEGLSVRVLGTVFNLRAYADETEIYTTLIQGSVVVEAAGQQQKLKPGELADYARTTGEMKVKVADLEEQIAWKDGLFYFKQLPLEDILRRVARWYDLEVFYAASGLRQQVFNGKMPMYSRVEDVLRKFEYAGEVRFELKGRTLTVYKR